MAEKREQSALFLRVLNNELCIMQMQPFSMPCICVHVEHKHSVMGNCRELVQHKREEQSKSQNGLKSGFCHVNTKKKETQNKR